MKNDFVFEWLELSQPPAVTHGTQTRTPRRLEQLSLFWGGCFSCAPCRLHRVVIHSRQTHTHTRGYKRHFEIDIFFLFWIPTIFRNNNGRDFFFLPPSTILDDNNWRKAVNWLGLVWSDIQSAETFCYSYVDIIIIQGMKWFLCVCVIDKFIRKLVEFVRIAWEMAYKSHWRCSFLEIKFWVVVKCRPFFSMLTPIGNIKKNKRKS